MERNRELEKLEWSVRMAAIEQQIAKLRIDMMFCQAEAAKIEVVDWTKTLNELDEIKNINIQALA